MNCYDLTLKYLEILADIDRAIERKSKVSTPTEHAWLDTEITRLEIAMIDIKRLLKGKEV